MKRNNQVKRGIFVIALGIALAFSPAYTFGQNTHANPDNHGWGKASDNGDNHASDRGNSQGVGHQQRGGNAAAPLDGGILALLVGGASAVYAARKRKKS
jgi:hypothetical protein